MKLSQLDQANRLVDEVETCQQVIEQCDTNQLDLINYLRMSRQVVLTDSGINAIVAIVRVETVRRLESAHAALKALGVEYNE